LSGNSRCNSRTLRTRRDPTLTIEEYTTQAKSASSKSLAVEPQAASSSSSPDAPAAASCGRGVTKRPGLETEFPATVKRACLVCDEFQPRSFFRLTEPTPAEAAARRATAAIAAAVGDVPARGNASTPPLGENAGGGNAAAFAAAPGAGDHTVRPAAGANAAASRPFSAAPLGVAGAPQDPGDAAAPPLGETAAAGDAAALGALPAAAPAIASVAAIAAAEVPDMDGTAAVERKASRDSAALALGSLVGEQQPPLHLVLAPLLRLTRLTYVFGLPNVYVGALDGRLGKGL